MITRITGILESVRTTSVTVSPEGAGLAYEVWLPAYLAGELVPREGTELTLSTIEMYEPTGTSGALRPRLVGFVAESDRRFYELFTTVKGVGGRRALRAMAVPASSIARAIEEGDAAALRAIPEIGRRLAETVIAELSGKVSEFLGGEPVLAEAKPALPADDAATQAVEALVRLGQQRPAAERAVARATESLGDGASADEILAAAFVSTA